jgi:predicted HTH transcriptional regulator
VAVTGTEPLTVDFKEGGKTAAIAECAAAMANAEGGLILVGITDQNREMVGVPREAMAHVADVLATRLQTPDWQPEMIEVPLGDDEPGRILPGQRHFRR